MSYLVGSEENTTWLRDRHRTGDTATCPCTGDRRPAMSGVRVGGCRRVSWRKDSTRVEGNVSFYRNGYFLYNSKNSNYFIGFVKGWPNKNLNTKNENPCAET